VSGEISNYVRHTSGHHYFTLKDDKAELSCTLWRRTASSIPVKLRDGLKVSVHGDINVYELRGRYQLNVAWILEKGVGELELKFRELKDRLAKEGLFDAERKKLIPKYPDSIGIVTSRTGAAVRDMINVITRRMPSCRIVLCPVAVQGPGADAEISDGIRLLNEYGDVELIIVGRGGGSMEDLWSFNEESTARAISDSKIPVISAVGHEIDITISDFVADLRAPTPSAAAELAVRDWMEEQRKIMSLRDRMSRRIGTIVDSYRARLVSVLRSHVFKRPESLISAPRQTVDGLSTRLQGACSRIVDGLVSRYGNANGKLMALSPKSVLKRGYAVCRKSRDGVILRRSNDVSRGENIRVELAVGSISGEVIDIHEE
jgi:exodeoxyribonuclease VII large subunit